MVRVKQKVANFRKFLIPFCVKIKCIAHTSLNSLKTWMVQVKKDNGLFTEKKLWMLVRIFFFSYRLQTVGRVIDLKVRMKSEMKYLRRRMCQKYDSE